MTRTSSIGSPRRGRRVPTRSSPGPGPA
jgi:hypothetical protein